MKRTVCILLGLILAFTLSGCGEFYRPVRYSETIIDSFDTITTVIAYDNKKTDFENSLNSVENELKRLDGLFDIYNEHEGVNNLCTLNKTAAKAPVKVEKDIIELLKYSKQAYNDSGGRVNICLGAVLEIWHNAREAALENPESAKLPDMAELEKASRHTDINDLVIDENNSTVFFKDKALRLDVGAVAKGFAAQKLADFIEKNGLWQDFMLNLGGNVVTRGYKGDDSTKWTIQIENPDREKNDALETLNLTNLCVVTSGDYQRYFTYNGKNYCHIIDPETLMPAEYFSGVTVICKDSALADRLSTQLFIIPLSEGKRIVEGLDGVEAVWVDKSFNVSYSSGFEQYKML